MTDNGEIPTPIEEASSAEPTPNVGPVPHVWGHLSPERMKDMQSLRQRGKEVVTEIGMLDVRKMRLYVTLSDIEAQGEVLMKEEAIRVGVPDGTPFQVDPKGGILVMGPPPTEETPKKAEGVVETEAGSPEKEASPT
jgi:hypothetical protein